MQRVLIVLAMTLGLAMSANAQVNVGVGIRGSGLSIGFNLSSYPDLVPVPGYPVYYYPEGNSNYFFYDGLYWVYEDDNWYASSWYNGPWDLMDPYYVPLFVLRVPVRYYHRPPAYFRGWRADDAPRWDEHWGRDWNDRRRGWDRWDHRAVPRPAPLPSYQSQYSGGRYPRVREQQQSIRSDKYRYEPKESVTRQSWQQQGNAARPRAESQHRPEPQQQRQQQAERPAPQQQRQQQTERPAPQQQRQRQAERPAPQQQRQQQAERPAPQQQRQQRAPDKQKDAEPDKDRKARGNKDDERGQGHR